MELIDRPLYMRRLEGFIGTPLVKVLTGLRRSGKSALLRMVRDRLVARGVAADRVLYLNFDAMEHSDLREADSLNAYLTQRAPAEGPYGVLLDEVQEVAGWERVVNSLVAHGRADIYVTGSNSTLLSSELATYIAGRYVSFEVAPLSFSEFVTFSTQTGQGPDDPEQAFRRFLRRGGFPGLFTADYSDEDARLIVTDIYASAVVRDVLARRSIRSPELFERIAAFALDNIGNPFSARRVAAFLKSEGKAASHQTVADYLAAMTDAFLLRKVLRYDLRGKDFLASTEKYYAGDHGLVNALLGFSQTRIPGLLENIVQAELRLRGYQVAVGKVGETEVDFVATRQDQRLYVQVCMTTLDPATRQRELAPLLAIRDSYPKYILAMDSLSISVDRGVRTMPIWDFLLAQGWSE